MYYGTVQNYRFDTQIVGIYLEMLEYKEFEADKLFDSTNEQGRNQLPNQEMVICLRIFAFFILVLGMFHNEYCPFRYIFYSPETALYSIGVIPISFLNFI